MLFALNALLSALIVFLLNKYGEKIQLGALQPDAAESSASHLIIQISDQSLFATVHTATHTPEDVSCVQVLREHCFMRKITSLAPALVGPPQAPHGTPGTWDSWRKSFRKQSGDRGACLRASQER